MLGAFRPSCAVLVGQIKFARKPWHLSPGQKRRVRQRLREVDSVVAALMESNVQCPRLEQVASTMKTEAEMSAREKYYVFSREPKNHMKPITQVPHFTKTPHPRGFPPGYQTQQEKARNKQ